MLSKNYSDSSNKYVKLTSARCLIFFINNLFVNFGGLVFQYTIGVLIKDYCASLLARGRIHTMFLFTKEAITPRVFNDKDENFSWKFPG